MGRSGIVKAEPENTIPKRCKTYKNVLDLNCFPGSTW